MSAVLLLIMATETERKQRGDDLYKFKGPQLNLMQIRFEFKQGYEQVTQSKCILLRKSLLERRAAVIHVFKHEKKCLRLLFEAYGSDLLKCVCVYTTFKTVPRF